jgi:hypothetical protein
LAALLNPNRFYRILVFIAVKSKVLTEFFNL